MAETPETLTWTFYADSSGKWRWTAKARNGQTVGASTQGYVRQDDCLANARLLGCPHDEIG